MGTAGSNGCCRVQLNCRCVIVSCDDWARQGCCTGPGFISTSPAKRRMTVRCASPRKLPKTLVGPCLPDGVVTRLESMNLEYSTC